MHINCGGKQVTVGRLKYDADEASGGGAKFFHHETRNWGFSSTGEFGIKNFDNYFIAENISLLKMTNSELYRTARISPLSLTYYARCLGNGNYTVKLHFAEIVMRDNRSYYSVGRRIFDVYIQVIIFVCSRILPLMFLILVLSVHFFLSFHVEKFTVVICYRKNW